LPPKSDSKRCDSKVVLLDDESDNDDDEKDDGEDDCLDPIDDDSSDGDSSDDDSDEDDDEHNSGDEDNHQHIVIDLAGDEKDGSVADMTGQFVEQTGKVSSCCNCSRTHRDAKSDQLMQERAFQVDLREFNVSLTLMYVI
jgi:hypothetical protein